MARLSDFDLDNDCEYMSFDEWRSGVLLGCFTDSDGYGYAATGDNVFEEPVYPSQVDDWSHDRATHILWFNK